MKNKINWAQHAGSKNSGLSRRLQQFISLSGGTFLLVHEFRYFRSSGALTTIKKNDTNNLIINMRTLASITLLMTFLINCISQTSAIYLKHRTNGEEKVIEEGSRIKVKLDNKHSIKGKFLISNDSLITIKNDTFLLSSIIEIDTKPISSQIISGTLKVIGGVVILAGVGAIVYLYAVTGVHGDAGMGLIPASFILLSGITLEGGGFLISSLNKKKYNIKKWNIQLKENNLAPITTLHDKSFEFNK